MSDDLTALKAKARLKHNNRGRCYPRRRCFACREVYPCLTIRLLDESDRLEEWQSSVSGALRSWDMFESGTWAGNKNGWGYHFELIGFLIRHYEATKAALANDSQEAAS